MNNYCNHLYDDSTEGFIQLLNIDENKQIKIYNTRINNIKEVIEEDQKQLDFFITPNTFYKPQRQVANIRQFRALFVDIDGCENNQCYISYKIFEMVDDGIIPKPTMIVDSGRGLHVYWRIHNAPYGALHTWQELVDLFCSRLKSIGSDSRATDASRVLRLPSTVNSRNNAYCRVMWQDNETEYSMYDLRESYLHEKYKKSIAKVNKDNKKVIANTFFNSYNLHMSRAEDLETLVKLRKGKMKGYRNMSIHCYAYWKGIYVRDPEELKEIIEAFNNSFDIPLKSTEVNAVLRCVPKAIDKFLEYEQGIRSGVTKRITKGMRDKGGYWYKNETLIERLDITEAEQRHLKTIIGTRVKYDRNNEKRKNKRRNENGLTSKQQELQDLKVKILQLKKEKMKNKEIANKLSIPLKTLERHISSMKKEGLL